MEVVRTNCWIKRYSTKWDQMDTLHNKKCWHKKVFVQPLKPLFKKKNTVGLQQYLCSIGLCRPDMEVSWKQWKKRDFWKSIHTHLLYLQKKWNGPKVKVYILPSEVRHPFISYLGGKAGISICGMIILFIYPTITTTELLALVTHEYHHQCRLTFSKESETSITLLESIVMEGLAEHAVQEQFGRERNAIWTRLYDNKKAMLMYNRWIKPNLYKRGRINHFCYLYGDLQKGIPLWLGYFIGYRLVQSAAYDKTTTQLLTVCAKSILQRSEFTDDK